MGNLLTHSGKLKSKFRARAKAALAAALCVLPGVADAGGKTAFGYFNMTALNQGSITGAKQTAR